MNNTIAIWKCKEHGEFKTKTRGRPICPTCKSVKLTFIKDFKPIDIDLNDKGTKLLLMPLSFSPKKSIIFVCCNCRAEFSIDSEIKGFNCPDCNAIFKKNEDGGYIEQ